MLPIRARNKVSNEPNMSWSVNSPRLISDQAVRSHDPRQGVKAAFGDVLHITLTGAARHRP
ncbi:hypothetical protein SAV14893_001790 [Streptomyces avermitilis]|uniref:Uncharacterized protein n=1 Tax=Streptomyces avermitilis TaxID=33903 RepID=A0A4D4N7I1_STRAX|nr:hypothetical protein SAVMC3_13790 [Streptomyces avermitilis]GDY60786.1 hypothetical protein SAV14893_001790 [Streptomyces avermitilis]GDY79137.1 hypothetical protein SAV31267_086220 [Streptomyces avermitilis]GDY88027.1 hypothetical protein SAVCW2_72260 [Streptomyces avermitilis]